MEEQLAKAKTIPSHWYFEPAHYERELRTVFSSHWHLACRRDQLAEPGFFVRTALGTEDVVLVRNKEGHTHCVSNICRHRGTELLKEASGKISRFNCRYHGWTYDLDGCLKKAPQFEGVENFSHDSYSLPSFGIAEWGPYFFSSLKKPEASLAQYLAPMQESLGKYNIADYKFYQRTHYDLKCNWKVYVDNYLDGGYHVPILHKALASVLDDKAYKIEVFDKSVLQSAPLQTNERLSSVRKGERALYWWVYPNIIFNFYEDVFDMNLVIPTGPESCRVYFDYFFKDVTNTVWINQSIEVAHAVQLEDIEVSESVQRGLHSQTYSQGRYSVKREAGDFLFHQLLKKDLAQP